MSTATLDASRAIYETGAYDADFGDDRWKANQMASLIAEHLDLSCLNSLADVGCGNGGVLANLRQKLHGQGAPLGRVVGYDIAPPPDEAASRYPDIEFLQRDFAQDQETYDLVTLNDVIEHVTSARHFLESFRDRARYFALHIPLDDRLSVHLTGQYNFRLQEVGHLSFWNASSAINVLTAAGLTPLACRFTPGFLAPSGRKRLSQMLSIPLRGLVWAVSPCLASKTVGGVSLAVLCRGGLR